MINYFNKRILEAIETGLNLAIDDIEDIDNDTISSKSGIIQNDNEIAKYQDAYKKFIDLDLPSGNLWCKFNLDAPASRSKNPLACDKIDFIGAFYAWGETKEKDGTEFKKLTYKFYNNETDKCEYAGELLSYKDDAAYVNNPYPFKIYTPSAQDFKELVDNTEQRYEKNYKNIEGLTGVVYKSKVNDNEIFLPSIAFKGSSELRNYTTVWDTPKSGYWTSEVADIDKYNDTSYMFIHNKEQVYLQQYWVSVRNMPQLRWYGAQIRPITKKRG